MTSESNASRQIQPYLPGMGDGSAIMRAARAGGFKEPHQMSPDEFASHPYAVFHSTHLDEPDLFNSEKRFGKSSVVHFGTLQAALDRHAITEDPANRGIEGRDADLSGHKEDARLHVFWHKPESLAVGRDTSKNDYEPGTRYYRNEVENAGSISLATSERDSVKSQHEYVTDAISQGKAHEVHPATMDMYKRGLLKKGFLLPAGYTRQYTMTPTRAVKIENQPTLPIPEDDYRFHEIGHDGDEIGWYLPAPMPERAYAPRLGPDLNRIKEQLGKDQNA
jgi:hypothetical protein